MMSKIRIHTIILISIYAILPIIVILMMHNMSISNILMRMGDYGFGSQQTMVYTEKDEDKYDFIDVVSKEKNPIAIYGDDKKQDGTTVRQIYFNNDYVNIPMESGRFFMSDDFVRGNNSVVVGKNLTGGIYEKNGNRFINVNDVECVVVGICGYKEETFYDNYIFINILSDISSDKTNYTIDFLSDMDIGEANDITKNYINKLRDKSINIGQMVLGEKNYISGIMPSADTTSWFIILVIACFLCLAVSSIQWVKVKKKEICIKRLLGASLGDISRELSLRYVIIAGTSIISGFIYSYLAYYGKVEFLLMGYFVLAIFVSVFILLVRKITAYQEITEVINQ